MSLLGQVGRTFSPCSAYPAMGDSYLAGPVQKYMDDYHCMLTSNDNDLSEPMGLSSLGVVDLDTSIIPYVFGLWEFDPLPGGQIPTYFSDAAGTVSEYPRVLVLDAAASPVNFHDIVLEDLRATRSSELGRFCWARSPHFGVVGRRFCSPACVNARMTWRASAGRAVNVRRKHTPTAGREFAHNVASSVPAPWIAT